MIADLPGVDRLVAKASGWRDRQIDDLILRDLVVVRAVQNNPIVCKCRFNATFIASCALGLEVGIRDRVA